MRVIYKHYVLGVVWSPLPSYPPYPHEPSKKAIYCSINTKYHLFTKRTYSLDELNSMHLSLYLFQLQFLFCSHKYRSIAYFFVGILNCVNLKLKIIKWQHLSCNNFRLKISKGIFSVLIYIFIILYIYIV